MDLTRYSFSGRAIARRIPATADWIPKWMNVVRAMSSEGWGRLAYHRNLRGLLDTDREVRRFHDGETAEVPAFYRNRIERELGPMYRWLPHGALDHDPNAYLKSADALVPLAPRAGRGTAHHHLPQRESPAPVPQGASAAPQAVIASPPGG